jgi:hemoglobin-like flavoprotein
MAQQGVKLMGMISTAVGLLNELDVLVPVLQDLGARHNGYGVIDSHYDDVAQALLQTLETGLGDKWNDELKAAWVEVYTIMAVTMKAAAKEAREKASA